jgi:hypothetical protein
VGEILIRIQWRFLAGSGFAKTECGSETLISTAEKPFKSHLDTERTYVQKVRRRVYVVTLQNIKTRGFSGEDFPI